MAEKRRRRRTLLGALLVVMVVAAATVFGGAFLVERWANARKDQAVGALQTRLGRPVKAGRIEVSWLGGLVVETRDVEIGAQPGGDEPGPALRVERARVRVGLTRALLSLGRHVHVKEVALTGVSASVVRFADGTINWRQIAERLASGDEAKAPLGAAARERIRGLIVEHAWLHGAQVRFVDRGKKGRAAAEVSDLDLAVRGVGLGEPFVVHLTAAVQSREKNLDLEARFAAANAGDRLSPPLLRRVAVRMKPVALAPLAPFLGPALAELTEGTLAANLTVDLGARAANGQGPMLAKGDVHLAGARIAGGERFDGRLDTDVVADLSAGNVTVGKLRVALGEMVISSAGRLLDLRGAPRFEDFTIDTQGLSFDTLRRYYPPLNETAGLVLGGPFTLSAKADASAGAQRFAVQVDLTRASIEVPGKLRKPAGTALTFEATGRAEGQTVRAERVVLVMADARVEGQGVLRARAGAARPFEATIDAQPIAVRQVAALLAPRDAGDLPDVRVGARVHARGTLGRPDSVQIQVPSFTAASGASQIAGSMTLQNLERPQITLDGKARFLDLDDFLPPHARDAAAARDGARKRSPSGPSSWLARTQGRTKLQVERGRAAGIDYHDLKADLTLAEGRLRAHGLEVGAFGGKFSGAGSELPLAGEGQPFIARGTVAAMDVGALLARFAPGSSVLRGQLSAEIDLSGRGTRPLDLQRSLTGKLSGGVAGAEFLPGAVLEPVVRSLSHAVRVPALASVLAQAEQRVPAVRDRALGDLAGAVSFAQGVLQIERPLAARTSYGSLSLGGKVRLDGRADLDGTVTVAPQVVTSLLAGKVVVTEPLPIKLRITGPWRNPRIAPTALDLPARVLAASFARGAATEGAQEQMQKAKEAAGRRLRRILPR